MFPSTLISSDVLDDAFLAAKPRRLGGVLERDGDGVFDDRPDDPAAAATPLDDGVTALIVRPRPPLGVLGSVPLLLLLELLLVF